MIIRAGQGVDDVGARRRWEGNYGSSAFSTGVCGALRMTGTHNIALSASTGLHRWYGREHGRAPRVSIDGNEAHGANTHG